MHDHSDPDLLLTALLFLLTQFVVQGGRPALSLAVIDHLERLAAYPDRLPPKLNRAIPRLLQRWHAIGGVQPSAAILSGRHRPTAEDTTAKTARILRFPGKGVQRGW